jgi:hypothetical protein
VADRTFTPHPAARVVASAHPIVGLWEAQRRPAGKNRIAARAETALVTRPGSHVLVQALGAAPGAFVAAVLTGETTLAAAEAAQALDPDFDPVAGWQPLLDGGALAQPRAEFLSHGDDR